MIQVKIIDKNGWFEDNITVQRYEDEVLTSCDHAGAELETIENEMHFPSRDITYKTRAFVCNKCDAWQDEDDNEWHDAPGEGKFYD